MGLHKAAWGQVVLRYICVLVCYCKRLDVYIYTAYQDVCINIETFLEPFLTIYLIIYFGSNLFSCSVYIQQLEYRRSTFNSLTSTHQR